MYHQPSRNHQNKLLIIIVLQSTYLLYVLITRTTDIYGSSRRFLWLLKNSDFSLCKSVHLHVLLVFEKNVIAYSFKNHYNQKIYVGNNNMLYIGT